MFSTILLLGILAPALGYIIPRQAPREIVSVPGAWFENIAVRPNGNLLLPRMDVPEVWEYDFAANQATRVATFSESLSTAGIAELSPDVWAVVSGRYSLSGGNTPGSWIIHSLDLTGGEAATSVLSELSQSQLINGMAGLNSTHVLPGDASAGVVYIVDTTTGASSVLKEDASMKPTGFIPFGLDGMKAHDGYLYYTNIATGNILRFLIPDGAVETLVTGNQGDDFVIGPDGLMYVALNVQNTVAAIDLESGTVTQLGSVAGGTSTAFGRREGVDEGILYVATSGGRVVALDVL